MDQPTSGEPEIIARPIGEQPEGISPGCTGHEWIDMTSVKDTERQFVCIRCGRRGQRNPRVVLIGEDPFDLS